VRRGGPENGRTCGGYDEQAVSESGWYWAGMEWMAWLVRDLRSKDIPLFLSAFRRRYMSLGRMDWLGRLAVSLAAHQETLWSRDT